MFGVAGACRRGELTNITINDVEQHGNMFLVGIPHRKTHRPRSFTITGEFYEIVARYQKLRPPLAKSNRFFLQFRDGRCTVQPIGINKFGAMPKLIAEYLQLPNADQYTGHSFRRSSASLLADTGAHRTIIKRHGGWKFTSVAEGTFLNHYL